VQEDILEEERMQQQGILEALDLSSQTLESVFRKHPTPELKVHPLTNALIQVLCDLPDQHNGLAFRAEGDGHGRTVEVPT